METNTQTVSPETFRTWAERNRDSAHPKFTSTICLVIGFSDKGIKIEMLDEPTVEEVKALALHRHQHIMDKASRMPTRGKNQRKNRDYEVRYAEQWLKLSQPDVAQACVDAFRAGTEHLARFGYVEFTF